jgi:hypothetical protein
MVRHTETVDDESTSTPRRTRADLRALSDYRRDPHGVDNDRVMRLVDHGWVTITNDLGQTSLTGFGDWLSGVVYELIEDVETDDLDMIVDLMGMGDFVDAATSFRDGEDGAKYFRTVLALANRVCEVRSLDDDPFDHDGLFAPYFAGFDAERRTVEMRFEDERVADAYVDEWCDGYAAVQIPGDAARVVIDTNPDA